MDKIGQASILKHCVLDNPYIPHKPTLKQAQFLLNFKPEVLFGGSVGGGKSDGLLMAALMFIPIKSYSALLLRRTYADLSLPHALIDRSHEWLDNTDARWNESLHQWRIPHGGTLTFGYLDSTNTKYRYQSSEFQFVGFDELTQFPEEGDYTYLFSRCRRLKGSFIPIRMRGATNAGGLGEDWVYRRWFIDQDPSREFVPSRLEDNPYLDITDYEKTLINLDPVTYQQLRNGVWKVRVQGNLFRNEWFRFIDGRELPYNPEKDGRVLRFWDLAATEAKKGKDPDYTAGVKIRLYNGRYYIEDVIKVRVPPAEVEKLIQQTAIRDGKQCTICIEQEPGASAKIVMDDIARRILQGFSFWPVKVSDPKLNFAKILSSACYNGNVYLVNAAWNKDFIDECVAFPTTGIHDDCVDAASKCIAQLPHYATKNNEDMGIAFGSGSEIELDWK